jgi:hypothetical protein
VAVYIVFSSIGLGTGNVKGFDVCVLMAVAAVLIQYHLKCSKRTGVIFLDFTVHFLPGMYKKGSKKGGKKGQL